LSHILVLIHKSKDGHAMAQVVSCQPVIVDTQVQSEVSPCEICDGQGGLSSSASFSHVHVIPQMLDINSSIIDSVQLQKLIVTLNDTLIKMQKKIYKLLLSKYRLIEF
jgi:hypothetical protein